MPSSAWQNAADSKQKGGSGRDRTKNKNMHPRKQRFATKERKEGGMPSALQADAETRVRRTRGNSNDRKHAPRPMRILKKPPSNDSSDNNIGGQINDSTSIPSTPKTPKSSDNIRSTPLTEPTMQPGSNLTDDKNPTGSGLLQILANTQEENDTKDIEGDDDYRISRNMGEQLENEHKGNRRSVSPSEEEQQKAVNSNESNFPHVLQWNKEEEKDESYGEISSMTRERECLEQKLASASFQQRTKENDACSAPRQPSICVDQFKLVRGPPEEKKEEDDVMSGDVWEYQVENVLNSPSTAEQTHQTTELKGPRVVFISEDDPQYDTQRILPSAPEGNIVISEWTGSLSNGEPRNLRFEDYCRYHESGSTLAHHNHLEQKTHIGYSVTNAASPIENEFQSSQFSHNHTFVDQACFKNDAPPQRAFVPYSLWEPSPFLHCASTMLGVLSDNSRPLDCSYVPGQEAAAQNYDDNAVDEGSLTYSESGPLESEDDCRIHESGSSFFHHNPLEQTTPIGADFPNTLCPRANEFQPSQFSHNHLFVDHAYTQNHSEIQRGYVPHSLWGSPPYFNVGYGMQGFVPMRQGWDNRYAYFAPYANCPPVQTTQSYSNQIPFYNTSTVAFSPSNNQQFPWHHASPGNWRTNQTMLPDPPMISPNHHQYYHHHYQHHYHHHYQHHHRHHPNSVELEHWDGSRGTPMKSRVEEQSSPMKPVWNRKIFEKNELRSNHRASYKFMQERAELMSCGTTDFLWMSVGLSKAEERSLWGDLRPSRLSTYLRSERTSGFPTDLVFSLADSGEIRTSKWYQYDEPVRYREVTTQSANNYQEKLNQFCRDIIQSNYRHCELLLFITNELIAIKKTSENVACRA